MLTGVEKQVTGGPRLKLLLSLSAHHFFAWYRQNNTLSASGLRMIKPSWTSSVNKSPSSLKPQNVLPLSIEPTAGFYPEPDESTLHFYNPFP
jgi:hypothetical protein